MKRAERTGNYAGFKVWVEGNVASLSLKACIEVCRKDWVEPLYHEVEYSEYVCKTRDGVPTRFWKDKPKTMLKKVVISQAFRLAFPDELAGMPYTQDEIYTVETEVIPNPKANVIMPEPKKTEPANDIPELPQKHTAPILEGENIISDYEASQDTGKPVESNPEVLDNKPFDPKMVITNLQQQRLWTIARVNRWSDEELKYYLKTALNIESTSDIPRDKYEGVCNFLDKNKR